MTPFAPCVHSTNEPRTRGARLEKASESWIAGSFVRITANADTYEQVATGGALIAGLAQKAAVGSGSQNPPNVLLGKNHDPVSPLDTIFAINISAGTTLTTTWTSATLAIGEQYGIRVQSNGVQTLDTSETSTKVFEIVGIHPNNTLGAAEPGTRVLVKIIPTAVQG